MLETVFVTGNLVPKSHVSLQVKCLDGGMVGSFEKTFHVGDGKAETGFQQTCGTDFLTGCEKRSRLAIEDTESTLRSNNRRPCLIGFTHFVSKIVLRDLLRGNQIEHTLRLLMPDKKLHGTAKIVQCYPREGLGTGTDSGSHLRSLQRA